MPQYIKELLWDVDLNKFEPQKYYYYTIERIVECGDIPAYNWMHKIYKKSQIEEVLRTSRRISLKSGNFYSLIYEIPKEEMECFRKPFTQKQQRF